MHISCRKVQPASVNFAVLGLDDVSSPSLLELENEVHWHDGPAWLSRAIGCCARGRRSCRKLNVEPRCGWEQAAVWPPHGRQRNHIWSTGPGRDAELRCLQQKKAGFVLRSEERWKDVKEGRYVLALVEETGRVPKDSTTSYS